MFTFEYPYVLLGFIGVPLLIFFHYWSLRHAKHKAMEFANLEALKRIDGRSVLTTNTAQLVLRVLVFTCFVFALSSPTYWYDAPATDHDYAFLIDTSSSMLTEDVNPTRLERAKQITRDITRTIGEGSRIGLLTVSGVVKIHEQPTQRHNDIEQAVQDVEATRTGGTDITGGIIQSVNSLINADTANNKVLLVSDGVETTSAYISQGMDEAIRYANRHNTVIDTIGVGGENGTAGYLPEYYNISAEYNDSTLRYLANQTGGTYTYHTAVNETLGRIQQAQRDGEMRDKPFDLQRPLSYVAALLLFIEFALSNTLYRRIT